MRNYDYKVPIKNSMYFPFYKIPFPLYCFSCGGIQKVHSENNFDINKEATRYNSPLLMRPTVLQ